jgi:hypothetical protein
VDYQYQTIVCKFLMDYLRGGEGRNLAKHAVGGIGEVVEVDGVLWGRRRRRALGEAVEGEVVEGEAIERRRGKSG